MLNYNITHNEDTTITRHDWTIDGYMLTITKYEDRYGRITIAAPLGAPELHVDDRSAAPTRKALPDAPAGALKNPSPPADLH